MENTKTRKWAHIPRENYEYMLHRNRRNGYVRKAWMLASRGSFIGYLPGQAGRHGIERQDPTSVEEHQFIKPTREDIGPFIASLPPKFADILLDFGKRYGWQEQFVGLAAQPIPDILPDRRPSP